LLVGAAQGRQHQLPFRVQAAAILHLLVQAPLVQQVVVAVGQVMTAAL